MLGRILVFIGGLMVVALTAALMAPFFIDWTDFRKDFEDQASRIIGKKVVVYGTVDARLLPSPSVTMTDVRVGQDGVGAPVLAIRSFSMDAELAPLLSGEVRIYNMHVDGPKLRLKLGADGTLDWVRTGNPQIAARTVVLERVAISDGEILFEDEQTGRTRTATGIAAELSARTLAGPWRIDGKASVDGEAIDYAFNASLPDEAGGVLLKSRLLPARYPVQAELEGLIRFVDLKPRYEGRFTLRRKPETGKTEAEASEKAAAGPRLSGTFELANDRIRLPAYELQMGNPADPYVVTGEATLDTGRSPEFLLKAEGQQIDMTRLGGEPATEGQEPADIEASPLSARIQAALALIADIPIPQVPGKADIRLPAIVAGDTTIRDIVLALRPDGNGWQIDKAEAQLPGRTRIEGNGRLSVIGEQGFAGHLLVASNQPSGFAEWISGSVPDPVRALKTAGFEANVDLRPGYQRLDQLEIALGPLNLKGSLEREEQLSGTPALSVDLSGNGLDYDMMAAIGRLISGSQNDAALIGTDLAARLDLGSFSAFGLEADRVTTAFNLSDGTLSVDRLSIGNLAGASLTASGTIDGLGDKPTGTAKIALKAGAQSTILSLIASRLPDHPLARGIAARESLYAPLDLSLDLSAGAGDWPVDIKLAGNAGGTDLTARITGQSLNLADSGGLALDLTADSADLSALLGQAGLPALPVETGQTAKLTLRVEQAPDSDPSVSASLTTPTTRASIEGQTSLSASHFLEGSYRAALASDDLEPALMASSVSLPGMGTGMPVDLRTTLYVMPEAIVLEAFEGKVADNPVAASLSLSRRTSPAVLDGSIDLGHADAAWLAEMVTGPVRNADGTLNTAPIPVPEAPLANLRLDVTAGTLAAGALPELGQASFHIDTETGKLTMSRLAGTFAGGRLSGQAELSNAEGSGLLQGRFEIHDADLKALVDAAGWPLEAAARADLSLIVEASGTTMAAMPDNASGSGTLTMDGLTVGGLNQAALPLILSAAERIEGEIDAANVTPLLGPALASGHFDAGRLAIPFTMAGGTLRAETIMAQNAMARVTGSVDLGLNDGRTEASLRLAFEPGDQALAGAEPAITISYAGLARDPGITIDPTELTNFLSLRKFEIERRRVEILQAAIQEKQRLRREANLYRGLEEERRTLREQAVANARLLAEAERILKERAKAEEAARKAQVPPAEDDVIIIPEQDPAPANP